MLPWPTGLPTRGRKSEEAFYDQISRVFALPIGLVEKDSRRASDIERIHAILHRNRNGFDAGRQNVGTDPVALTSEDQTAVGGQIGAGNLPIGMRMRGEAANVLGAQ